MHATPIFEFPQHGNVHTMFENSQTNTLASAGTGLQDQTQGFPVGAEHRHRYTQRHRSESVEPRLCKTAPARKATRFMRLRLDKFQRTCNQNLVNNRILIIYNMVIIIARSCFLTSFKVNDKKFNINSEINVYDELFNFY